MKNVFPESQREREREITRQNVGLGERMRENKRDNLSPNNPLSFAAHHTYLPGHSVNWKQILPKYRTQINKHMYIQM